MVKIQNTDKVPTSGQDAEQQELIRCWWECKTAPSLWKKVWQLLNVVLPYNLATE